MPDFRLRLSLARGILISSLNIVGVIMIHNEERKAEYYQALLEKKSDYEGVFYVGVTSTGVFAGRLVQPGNQSTITVSSTRLRSRHCWLPFAPVSAAVPCRIRIMSLISSGCLLRPLSRTRRSAGRDKTSKSYPLMNPLPAVNLKSALA